MHTLGPTRRRLALEAARRVGTRAPGSVFVLCVRTHTKRWRDHGTPQLTTHARAHLLHHTRPRPTAARALSSRRSARVGARGARLTATTRMRGGLNMNTYAPQEVGRILKWQPRNRTSVDISAAPFCSAVRRSPAPASPARYVSESCPMSVGRLAKPGALPMSCTSEAVGSSCFCWMSRCTVS